MYNSIREGLFAAYSNTLFLIETVLIRVVKEVVEALNKKTVLIFR